MSKVKVWCVNCGRVEETKVSSTKGEQWEEINGERRMQWVCPKCIRKLGGEINPVAIADPEMW